MSPFTSGSSLRRRLWSIVPSSARDVVNAGVQLIDNRSESPFPEQLDPLAGGIEDREGRLEEVVEADASGGDAAVLEQAQIGGLDGSERTGDQPSPEGLLDLLLAALDAQSAQCRADEIDQRAAGIADGIVG